MEKNKSQDNHKGSLMTQTLTVEDILNTPKTSYFNIHRPASNGFVEKVGYKVALTTEEIIDYILLYQAAHPEAVINYKNLRFNGVAVFVGKDYTTEEIWETILGVPLTKLPAK